VTDATRRGGRAWVVLAALLATGAVVVTVGAANDGAARLDWQPRLGLQEPWRLWTAAWVHWSTAHLLVNLAGAAVVAFVGRRARLPWGATAAWLAAWPLTQALMAAVDSDRLGAAMPHYGGLSGVLHAGVVVLGLTLAWPSPRARARSRLAPAGADTGFTSTHATGIEPSRLTEGPWAMTELGVPTALPVSTLEPPPPATAADGPGQRDRWIGAAIVVGTVMKVLFEAPWQFAPRTSEALGIAVAPIAHACGLAAGALAWGAWRLLARRGR